MDNFRDYLNRIKLFFIDKFTTDTGELISQLGKLEAKIERAINKDLRKGAQLVASAAALNAAIKQNDTNLNTAYRLLHNVNKLAS